MATAKDFDHAVKHKLHSTREVIHVHIWRHTIQ
jgi:hypothetical protein